MITYVLITVASAFVMAMCALLHFIYPQSGWAFTGLASWAGCLIACVLYAFLCGVENASNDCKRRGN